MINILKIPVIAAILVIAFIWLLIIWLTDPYNPLDNG